METNTYKRLKDKARTNNPAYIIVHHSASNVPTETVEGIERYHLSRGWEGIGYTYILEQDGTVWKGRPEHYHGAHTSNYNTQSIGICLMGNFSEGATMPTKAQENALTSLLGAIKGRYPAITDDKILPHRHFQSTECYGKNLKDDWARNLLKEAPVENSKTEIQKAIAILQSLL